MATTRLLTIHINKGKSIARTLSERTDYAQNPDKTVNRPISKPIENIIANQTKYAKNSDKTHGGELVKCYACAPQTVDEEFLLSKKEYDYITGRDQGEKNVLAYHIRQAFKPGEIEPEKALEIGYELAMRFTKGNHAFIVATHTDKLHIHNHIVFNSTALSHDKKFRDFKRSGMALRRLSDLLCIEHGLSVIENPGPSKGKNYAKWLGSKDPSLVADCVCCSTMQPTWQDKLRQKIDEILPPCSTFEEFISAMKLAGYIINDKRKHITFLAPGQKKPTRLNTLKGDYTEEAIRERISKAKETPINTKNIETAVSVPAYGGTIKVSWLIDIQAKIQEGKGAGYENWARIFNIKEAAKTLLYLKENGIDSYDELVEKSTKISKEFSLGSDKIKVIEKRQKEIAELQRQIGTYGKTRDTYMAYKKSGFSEKFYETNRADITLHEASKKYFDNLGIKKLPKISELKQEYAMLQVEKKKLYADYHANKKTMQELLIAKSNAQQILGITPDVKNHETPHTTINKESPEF